MRASSSELGRSCPKEPTATCVTKGDVWPSVANMDRASSYLHTPTTPQRGLATLSFDLSRLAPQPLQLPVPPRQQWLQGEQCNCSRCVPHRLLRPGLLRRDCTPRAPPRSSQPRQSISEYRAASCSRDSTLAFRPTSGAKCTNIRMCVLSCTQVLHSAPLHPRLFLLFHIYIYTL